MGKFEGVLKLCAVVISFSFLRIHTKGYLSISGICADDQPILLSIKLTLRYSVMPEVGRV